MNTTALIAIAGGTAGVLATLEIGPELGKVIVACVNAVAAATVAVAAKLLARNLLDSKRRAKRTRTKRRHNP